MHADSKLVKRQNCFFYTNIDVEIKEVCSALERFAPLPLQEEYDNAGLQIGLTMADVSGVLLCLDVTESVLEEAVEKGCNMIVSHHPLLFRSLRHITEDTQAERCTRYAIKHDLAIYSAHTNLDNAPGGVNFEMARRLELTDCRFLQSQDGKSGSGLLGELPQSVSAEIFLRKVKGTFGVDCLQHNTLLSRPIKTVALCGGAGDFLLDEAITAGADVFLTGEMHYHVFFGHEQEIQIGVLGHYQSEKFTIDLLERILKERFPKLHIEKTTICTNPICYM